jgi:hypothetical protein
MLTFGDPAVLQWLAEYQQGYRAAQCEHQASFSTAIRQLTLADS